MNMNNKKRKLLSLAGCMLAAFALWTAAICLVDVRPIGPLETRVGFAALNGFIHNLTGVHMPLYILTDWLSLIPACFVLGFALLGLMQWIRRKNLLKVDCSILLLGGFYVLVLLAFVLFEVFPVNFRPVLIDGKPEASYPSSTTMLVLCVIPTAILQLRSRIRSCPVRRVVSVLLILFAAFMVIARLISGVHWFTDIIGGALLSAALVTLYAALNA